MKIIDLVEDIITETDEQLMQQLLDKFRKTTGEFNNASHKFYSVRKALSNELDGDDQEAVKKVSPGEFFAYLKSQKSNTQKPPQASSEPVETSPRTHVELRGVTAEELEQLGTVYAVISKWVDDYYPEYSADEIADVLFKSEMGRYEEYPYIAKEVRSAILRNQRRDKEKEDSIARPKVEKLKPSKNELDQLKGSRVYNEVLGELKHRVDNQALQPGEKPQSARKLFGYLRNQIIAQYNTRALDSIKKGRDELAKSYVIKREIAKSLKTTEFVNWYIDNKEA